MKKEGVRMLIFEPTLNDDSFFGDEVTHDIESFKERSTLIVTNRYDQVLSDVKEKVYTKDLFKRD